MKRLFFALWPNEIQRNECCAIIKKLPDTAGKPVPANNLHITLLFLGQVNETQQVNISTKAAKLPAPDMSLRFDRLSYWKKPSILCLTTSHYAAEVDILVNQLSLIAIDNEIRIEDRPYQPHITLLRSAKFASNITIPPCDWHSNAFVLVESCSLPNGVNYRVIENFGG